MSLRRLRHSARLLVAVPVIVLALASCGDEDGQATPGGPTIPPPSTVASSSPSSPPGQGGGELEKVKACDLLTGSEIAAIGDGISVTQLGPLGGASDVCEWSTDIDDVPIDKSIGFNIAIRPRQIVDDYLDSGTGKVTDGETDDGRKAKQIAGSTGDCIITFAAEKGRVDITVSGSATERSCKLANEVSSLIEPRVPEPTA